MWFFGDGVEHWLMPNAAARATQLVLEQWGPGGTTTPLAVVTTVALEQWAVAAAANRAAPMISIIRA
jgi:hypothetical protein